MDIRMYRTADNPRNIQKYYTRDSSLVPGPFSNVDSAEFGPGSELDLAALKLDFEAVQEGSGDPSPDNVRPIVGKTQAVVNLRSGSEYSAVTKSFGGTYYGGTYDAVSGILTVTHDIIQLSNFTWSNTSAPNGVFRTLNNNSIWLNYKFNGVILSNAYKQANSITWNNFNNFECNLTNTAINPLFRVKDSNLINATPDEATAYFSNSGFYVVCERKTPQTVSVGQLTGLNFFPGENRLWGSDMMINELAFTAKTGSTAILKTNGFEVPDAAFISENDRRNPVLRVLSGTNLTEYNYVYISEYDRFYFAEVTNLANGVYLIHCHLDLLMSCKDKIKALNCTVERSASDGSSYLADDQYPVNSYKKYVTRLFPHAVDGNSYILMTVGNKIIEE